MIIERIPTFLLSTDDFFDSFAFDNSGRFIFCRRNAAETGHIIFIIYDVIFNNYIELTASPSNPNLHGRYEDESIWSSIQYILPISVEQMLMVAINGSTTALLLLVYFDLQKKVFKIQDYKNILKCQYPEFVRDGDIFGLFYQSSINGKQLLGTVDNENWFFMLKNFTVQENQIILGGEKRLNISPLNSVDYPLDLYLRGNKLWYIRKKSQEIMAALTPYHKELYRMSKNSNDPIVPEDPTKNNLRICFFDLEEKLPSETFVTEIQMEESDTNPIIQWVQDSLLFLQFGTKFDVFNLLNFEWTSEALDSGIDFTNLDKNGRWQSKGAWIEFQCDKNPDAAWAHFSAVHIDDEYVITVVNRNYTLHRIPLKEPLKLSMIAWSCALNAGLIHQNKSLPPKLPFSKVL